MKHFQFHQQKPHKFLTTAKSYTMHAYQGFIISLHKQAVCTKLNDWIGQRITQVCDFATIGAVAVAIIVQLDTLPLSSTCTLAITIDSQYDKFMQGWTWDFFLKILTFCHD